jgi:hypothetical protein
MREKFEETIKNSPYEYRIERWGEGAENAWPGQYKDPIVQMAWELWVEAWNTAMMTAAKACEDIAYDHKNSAFLGPEMNALACAKRVNTMTLET